MILNNQLQDDFLEALFKEIPINKTFVYDDIYNPIFELLSEDERKKIFTPNASGMFLSYLLNGKIIELVSEGTFRLTADRGFLAKELKGIGEYDKFRKRQLKAEIAGHQSEIYWIFRLSVAAIIGVIATLIIDLKCNGKTNSQQGQQQSQVEHIIKVPDQSILKPFSK